MAHAQASDIHRRHFLLTLPIPHPDSQSVRPRLEHSGHLGQSAGGRYRILDRGERSGDCGRLPELPARGTANHEAFRLAPAGIQRAPRLNPSVTLYPYSLQV